MEADPLTIDELDWGQTMIAELTINGAAVKWAYSDNREQSKGHTDDEIIDGTANDCHRATLRMSRESL
jgi:hypothetical protein